jgi:hypothetical protein
MFASGTWIDRNPCGLGALRLLESAPKFAPLVRTEFALPSWVGEIRQDEYLEIRNLCVQMLSRYRVEDCLFIGIGRSPTPIIGFFQEARAAHARNLPLSQFRHRPVGRAVEIDEKKIDRYQALSDGALKALYQHFDRFFLFDAEAWRRKKWVLVDFSQTGDTLVSAFDYLSAYLRHRKTKAGCPGLEMLCLVDPRYDPQKIMGAFGRRPARVWKIDGYPSLCGGLSMQRYDLASEFGTFVVDDSGRVPVRNDAYKRLRAAIRKEMVWEALQGRSSEVA